MTKLYLSNKTGGDCVQSGQTMGLIAAISVSILLFVALGIYSKSK